MFFCVCWPAAIRLTTDFFGYSDGRWFHGHIMASDTPDYVYQDVSVRLLWPFLVATSLHCTHRGCF